MARKREMGTPFQAAPHRRSRRSTVLEHFTAKTLLESPRALLVLPLKPLSVKLRHVDTTLTVKVL